MTNVHNSGKEILKIVAPVHNLNYDMRIWQMFTFLSSQLIFSFLRLQNSQFDLRLNLFDLIPFHVDFFPRTNDGNHCWIAFCNKDEIEITKFIKN